ncbi:hypothetical protein FQZ97_1127560 [compost metagenome]
MYCDNHSLVVSLASGRSPPRASANLAPIFAACLVKPPSSMPQPPLATLMILPSIRKTVAGLGSRRSSSTSSKAKVSSKVDPFSIAMAPMLTVKPSICSLEARPPTRPRLSATSTFLPAATRRAATLRPPAPAPITTAS